MALLKEAAYLMMGEPLYCHDQYGPRPRLAQPQVVWPVPAGTPAFYAYAGPDAPYGILVPEPPRTAIPPAQYATAISAFTKLLPDPIPTNEKDVDTKEVKEEAAATLETPLSPPSTSNGAAQEESETLTYYPRPRVAQPQVVWPVPAGTPAFYAYAGPDAPYGILVPGPPRTAIPPAQFAPEISAFTEQEQEEEPEPEPQPPVASPPAQEEAELTRQDKMDLGDAENIQPESPQLTTPGKENLYKDGQRESINRKKYEREFLLKLQFLSVSLIKPTGLRVINGVILDKPNTSSLEPSRKADITPSFANFGGSGMGASRGPMTSMKPRKIINLPLHPIVHLNKAEKAWKPSTHTSLFNSQPKELQNREAEQTKDLLKQFCSILNKMTPEKFEKLMEQVDNLSIDSEERLKGVIDRIFEKAISEPHFSEIYAKMCRVLIGLKVQSKDNPGGQVDFHKLLLNRCQKEFEKDKDCIEIFEKKQKELDAATEEEKEHLQEDLQVAKDKARRRSLGNIKFIGELFKLKMLTEVVVHDCIIKLLKNFDDESLEILCKLLSTIGKDLDVKKEKRRVDQCFHQMEKIMKEKKITSRIRFMMQDVLDLRLNNWVPRRLTQGPKTIDQIKNEADMEKMKGLH